MVNEIPGEVVVAAAFSSALNEADRAEALRLVQEVLTLRAEVKLWKDYVESMSKRIDAQTEDMKNLAHQENLADKYRAALREIADGTAAKDCGGCPALEARARKALEGEK